MVAPEFTDDPKKLCNNDKFNIELFKVNRFSNGVLAVEHFAKNKPKASNEKVNHQDTKTNETCTEQDHLEGRSTHKQVPTEEIKSAYLQFKNDIQKYIDEIKCTPTYIKFINKKEKPAFCSLFFRKNILKVYLKFDNKIIKDELNIARRMVTNGNSIGHNGQVGKNDYEITFTNYKKGKYTVQKDNQTKEISKEYLLCLIEQSLQEL